jgi:hypothetical protein
MDFDYEQFRWQPEACEMPDFEASVLEEVHVHYISKMNLEIIYCIV